MRKINRIVIHCTATPQSTTKESIENYWYKVKKWNNPGYHILIHPVGAIFQLLNFDEIANGARGFNHDSIHVSYIGGVDDKNVPVDNRTADQKNAMLKVILELHEFYPEADILGHRDLPEVTKACPSFDVKTWLKEIELS